MKFVKKYSIVGLFFVALLLMVGCGANDTDASAITTEKIDKIVRGKMNLPSCGKEFFLTR